jgi:hypothetical protein
MSERTRLWAAALLLFLAPAAAPAQALWQPAPQPTITAENESWYQAGDPIIWSGAYYYKAGAARHFDPHQMVRSGSYQGIPLYIDPTVAPYDQVLVPLPGGLMQPYERQRGGALAGTTGNIIPTIPPVGIAEARAAAANPAAPEVYALPQAPGPFGLEHAYETPVIRPPASTIIVTQAPAPVGTAGTNVGSAAVRETTARRPVGIDAIWVQFDGRRWYADGPTLAYSADAFTSIGTYHGFPVYRRDGDPSRVYIPSVPGGPLAPYSTTKPSLNPDRR